MCMQVEIKRSLEANGFNQIVCPAPMLDLCAKRLIVMERLDGVPFTHILHPSASQELQKRYMRPAPTSAA
jgi:predicted unusual protein kinase regulating ubiquinone biosynthesis (AarF/ABC1/UbiB family)